MRLLPRIEGYHCFACGTENPQGLRMRFAVLDDEIRSNLVLGEHHVGWENIAHGGVVSAVLDEIMAWSILYFRRSFCVTREINVQFLKPVYVGRSITAIGRIVEQEKKKTPRQFACQVEGRIEDEKGVMLARGVGDFALLRQEQMNLIPENVRRDLLTFMKALEEGRVFSD